MMRPSFGDTIGADLSVTYVSPAALEAGLAETLGLRRRLAAVEPTRHIGKADMKNNDVLPSIRIRPDTFEIAIDGEDVRAGTRGIPPPRPAVQHVLRRSMDSAAHTVALLLADARLPSGGHAFSAGVEPAIQGGLARADVGAFLQARARTTTLVDAATAVVARRAGLIGAPYAPGRTGVGGAHPEPRGAHRLDRTSAAGFCDSLSACGRSLRRSPP